MDNNFARTQASYDAQEPPDDGSDFLTTQQAGALLHVRASRVRQLILGGKLGATKFGHIWAVHVEDVDRYLDGKKERAA